MSRRTSRVALWATTALTMTAGAALAQDYTKYGIKADVEGQCSFASIDAKD